MCFFCWSLLKIWSRNQFQEASLTKTHKPLKSWTRNDGENSCARFQVKESYSDNSINNSTTVDYCEMLTPLKWSISRIHLNDTRKQKTHLECRLTWAVAQCGDSTPLRKHAVHHTDLLSLIQSEDVGFSWALRALFPEKKKSIWNSQTLKDCKK